MRKSPSVRTLSIDQPVWFVLIKVRITGRTKQPWVPGSTALVHAFVPGKRLEDCLTLLDGFLPTEELVRIDTLKAERFEPEDEIEPSNNYFWEPLERAAATNECALGVFVVSEASATPIKGRGLE